ncbi:hypothetical protein [Tateyamaria sp. ANG-S1]|uniref:hypothetical protein n=1 Tax=Tateyamaria sp. ANG-S1 TaxID=1577905 RepID=UPI0005806F62|nr:hypothetical protein [Tateyamaria sp. ANG-S1]KIC51256.1 hypothetical protein RA29_05320 [Tateyamaria sp. ANG-S1]
MYNGDSFQTLTVAGQAGLVAVSLLFSVLALGFTWVLVQRRPLIIRVPVWLVAFITFVWASPQGYYTYYRMIFDGLPAQTVIQAPPPPEEILALLTFTGPVSLAAHSIGVLGWLMFVVAVWPQRRKCRNAAD